MRKPLITLLVLGVVIAAVVVMYPSAHAAGSLRLYAGAGLRPVADRLAAAFQAESGIKVECDYGGSGEVLARAREDGRADLFLPGDGWYVDRMEELAPGRVAQRQTVAYLVPVIIVRKDSEKTRSLKGLADLGGGDLRVGLGKNPSTQIGRTSAVMLTQAGVHIPPQRLQEALTVNELGVWVKMKAVDAAIVWDAIAAGLGEEVTTIRLPPEQAAPSLVVAARLSTSKSPEMAKRFLAFLASPRAQAIFAQTGYSTKKL
ncbi:MAG: substrate-binding domain-containing protein [Planctomycetaceae bacterium]|nr:substrate-binding domain-containing protein [Planctomycetaceae bacterium]